MNKREILGNTTNVLELDKTSEICKHVIQTLLQPNSKFLDIIC